MRDWSHWLDTLDSLHSVRIYRSFVAFEFGAVVQRSLHIFADAFLDAIGHVMYVEVINTCGRSHVSFVKGESKVAPRAATSGPAIGALRCG